ncbi:hypothetical protein AXFE_01390 [Acidithrix ferrooxidans]|uniref:Transposase zinc-ribbon domain protein n=1 Tax=Acidithrix ferrooxidans TaxID=1280514 RepID=A0A0D8HMV9_9ACTN|nr:hypothetical protein AXFE_01390 [Acidithrix ferrooxidans]
MDLAQLIRRYSSESACEEHLFQFRCDNGLRCRRCDDDSFVLVHSKTHSKSTSQKTLIECKSCHYQTSLKSGTIFQASKVPLRKWFIAAYLIANDKRKPDAEVMAQFLEVSKPTAQLLINKTEREMAEPTSFWKWIS